MDADGTNERILVPEISAAHGLGPVWSPDGERIAYQRDLTICPMSADRAARSTEVVLLTVNPDDPPEPAGTEVVIPPPQTTGPDGQPIWWYPFSVTWSPDGTVLLYFAWAESADGFAHGTSRRSVAGRRDTTGRPVGRPRAAVYSGVLGCLSKVGDANKREH